MHKYCRFRSRGPGWGLESPPTKQRVMAGSRQLWTVWYALSTYHGRRRAATAAGLMHVCYACSPCRALRWLLGCGRIGRRTGGVEAVRAKDAIAAASSTDTHSKQLGNWPTRPWLEACWTLKHSFHRCFALLCASAAFRLKHKHCIVHRRMHCTSALGPIFFPPSPSPSPAE